MFQLIESDITFRQLLQRRCLVAIKALLLQTDCTSTQRIRAFLGNLLRSVFIRGFLL